MIITYLSILFPHASNLNCFYQLKRQCIKDLKSPISVESWGSSDFDQTGLVWRYQWDNSKSKISAPQNYPFRKYRRTKKLGIIEFIKMLKSSNVNYFLNSCSNYSKFGLEVRIQIIPFCKSYQVSIHWVLSFVKVSFFALITLNYHLIR